ncbi:IclR family transcriptional regulator [Rhizobium sp. Td3]|nr:IclR family transcriptional regulator [Rhizobium sp. Td3]
MGRSTLMCQGGCMTADQQSSQISDTVPALRRAVRILDMVAGSPQHLTAAELTRLMELPKSTAHGLLAVMVELDLLAKSADGTLRAGPHPLRWANGFLSQLDIVSTFHEQLAERHDLDPYTVTLTVREGGEVVYIGCRNSAQPLGHTFRIGMRLPAPFTATGKMLLSDLSTDELKSLFESFPPPLTPRSVSSLSKLEHELASTRSRGYSIDDGQIREGMLCIGAAIRDYSGAASAGIALSLIRSEASDEKIARLGEELRDTANALSEKLGYRIAQ